MLFFWSSHPVIILLFPYGMLFTLAKGKTIRLLYRQFHCHLQMELHSNQRVLHEMMCSSHPDENMLIYPFTCVVPCLLSILKQYSKTFPLLRSANKDKNLNCFVVLHTGLWCCENKQHAEVSAEKNWDLSKAEHQKICLNMSESFKTNNNKKNPTLNVIQQCWKQTANPNLLE